MSIMKFSILLNRIENVFRKTTDTHLCLADVSVAGVTGKDVEDVFNDCCATLRVLIPYDGDRNDSNRQVVDLLSECGTKYNFRAAFLQIVALFFA